MCNELEKDSYSFVVINTDTIAKNYHDICNFVYPTKVAAVVKANAYGLGIEMIATSLYKKGCRNFFVAYTDEGIELKNSLEKNNIYKAHIYVFNGPYLGSWTSLYQHHGLIPVLNTLKNIEEWNKYGSSIKRPLSAVLHIDTGINRLGLIEKELEIFLKKTFSFINLEYAITHFACAAEPDSDFHKQQVKKIKRIKSLLPSDIKLCVCNSKGIFSNKECHFDMVRPGFALYGINPSPNKKNPLTPCVELYSRVIHIQNIKKGEYVGYGATFKAQKDMKVATLAIGYADGLFWNLAHKKAFVFFNKIKAPIIGRISMDLTAIDVTHIPYIKNGDLVEIIGQRQSIEDLAKLSETIPYEILLKLGKRCKKVYIGDTLIRNERKVS
ncbi:MAG: alanine racemase [Alphaproteobacteria bacterium]